MEPVRVRVSRIIDFGRTVTIVGVDLTSNEPVMVHVDHRPFDDVFAAKKIVAQTKPTVFEADGLTLSVGLELNTGDEDTTPRRAA